MSRADDIRELLETTADIPSRFGTSTPLPGDGIYITSVDPDNNYPPPPANVYYAQKCSASFTKSVGNQGLSVGQGGGQGQYVCNIGDAYIGLGTYISVRKIGAQYYTEVRGPQLYYGITGTVPLPGTAGYGFMPVTVQQISGVGNLGSPFVTTFVQKYPYPVPNNWPVIGVTATGQVWHLDQLGLVQPAYTLAYIPPFGIGTGTLLNAPSNWPSANVQIIDIEGYGMYPLDQQSMIAYTNVNAEVYDNLVPPAGWVLLDGGCCSGEGF